MNQNVKITRQQAEEEAKMLEKVFDVVRFLEGDFFEQMQKVICLHPHAVILREKDLTEREYTALARSVKKICTADGIVCIYHNYAAAIKGDKDPNLQ